MTLHRTDATVPTYEQALIAYTRILHEATDDERHEGKNWYPLAMLRLQALYPPGPLSVESDRLAVVAAHLSPRLSWDQCVMATGECMHRNARPGYVMMANWDRACKARNSDEPFTTFGTRAIKTREFALSLRGDVNAACIDTHMIHAALSDVRVLTYSELDSTEFRQAQRPCMEALRALAAVRGIPAHQIQATIWVAWKNRKWTR